MFLKRLIVLHVFIMGIIFWSCDNTQMPSEPSEPQFVSLNEEIDYFASQFVKVGAVVGIIDRNQQRRIYTYGSKSLTENEPPDANTVFDIGSITKTFTCILLADMVLQGRMDLDDPVTNYLPSDQVILPSLNGSEITFYHLATHMSGLPRTPHVAGSPYPRPDNFVSNNPYSVYTTEDVYDYLTNYCVLVFEPGTYWGYSNTGAGLLGHTLGLIDGSSFESLLTRKIFDVLGMDNSSVSLSEQQRDNCAVGHNPNYDVMPNYTANDIFQGAGFIKSSLNDMFSYLEANMGLRETSLMQAMEKTHQQTPGIYTGTLGYIGLAWYIRELGDGQKVIYSGGDTGGFSTYIGFNQSTSTGVIILLNAQFRDSANLIFGPAVLRAIMKYE